MELAGAVVAGVVAVGGGVVGLVEGVRVAAGVGVVVVIVGGGMVGWQWPGGSSGHGVRCRGRGVARERLGGSGRGSTSGSARSGDDVREMADC